VGRQFLVIENEAFAAGNMADHSARAKKPRCENGSNIAFSES
jgi:hypothetical protein